MIAATAASAIAIAAAATTPVATANNAIKARSCASRDDGSWPRDAEPLIAMPCGSLIVAASIAMPVKTASGGNAGKMYTRHLPCEVEKKAKIAANQQSVKTDASG